MAGPRVIAPQGPPAAEPRTNGADRNGEGAAAVLRAEGLYLRPEGSPAYGPFDLELKAGEGALVLVPDLDLLRRLMRCCLGFEVPECGRVAWWSDEAGPGEAGSGEAADWARYDFYRQIGYVDRQSQLLSSLSLLNHLLLFHRYAGLADDQELENSRRLLDQFGLGEYEALRADDLPEPRRRLALYALALAQNPRLMLMERPMQFLDRDFDLVWDRVLTRADRDGLAYIVFDRSQAQYSPEHFHSIISFSPGRL